MTKFNSISTMLRPLLALLAVVTLSACAFERIGNQINATQPVTPPVMPVMAAANPQRGPDQRADGSLWTPGISGNPFSDDKAFRRGDIVLVKVVQKNSGSKKANLDTTRDSSISARIKYFLGLENGVNSLTGYAAPAATTAATGTGSSSSGWDPGDLLNASSSRSYKGEGQMERTDVLEATVTAVVTEVLTNGNLLIYGHQTVTLNHEASVLTVQGVVRPSDISIDNAVDSGRIANANIQFSGSGVISDQQQPGWGTRIFDWVWPF